jgi:hypothetical protein
MELEKVKEKAEEDCKVVESAIIKIDKSIHGTLLREKMLELTGHMAQFNTLVDRSSLSVGKQKRMVDLIDSIAMQSVSLDPELSKKPVSMKEYYKENYKVILEDRETTLYDEKVRLEYYQYGLNRYKSTYEALKTTIMVCQSALSFDRVELQNTNIQ